MAKLVVRMADGRTREYELLEVNTIGRHPGQTIQCLDRLVSKEHIIVRKDGPRWTLQDLGSLNGTYINDVRITGNVALHHRDRIAVGSTNMVFYDEVEAGTGKHEVSIGDALESSICNAVAQTTAEEFLPVDMIQDVDSLKRDYEKLRIAARLQHDIAGDVRMESLLPRLLDQLFGLFKADRGLILLAGDDGGRLIPRAVKVRGKKTSEPISLSKTILRKVLTERQAVLTSDALHDARFSQAKSIIIQGIRSSMCVPLLARDKSVIGIIHLDSQMAANAFTEKDLAMLQGIAQQASIAVENSRLVEKIEAAALTRQKFEKMLSPNLVEQVVSGELSIEKGGQMRRISVMFTDIRGFTALSEKAPPQDLVKMLNEYFEVLVDQIFETNGTVDKFIGDAVMAIWSAPVDVEDASLKATEAGVKIQKVMAEFNQLREMDGLPPIHTGIGIDTGEAVAGYMGSTKTMSYTVVGPTVNRAARLCGIAKAGETLIGESVFDECGSRLHYEARDGAMLKGIEEAVAHWSVTDIR